MRPVESAKLPTLAVRICAAACLGVCVDLFVYSVAIAEKNQESAKLWANKNTFMYDALPYKLLQGDSPIVIGSTHIFGKRKYSGREYPTWKRF